MKEKLDIDWGIYFNECKYDIDMVCEMFMNNFDDAERECIPKKIENWQNEIQLPP